MSLYYLSSFNKISYKGSHSIYKNFITNRFISYNSQVHEMILKAINQQLNALEDDLSLRVLQIITAELLYRGIIIPIEHKNDEEEYLSSIVFFENSGSTFLKSKIISEAKLKSISQDDSRIIFCGIPYDIGAKNPGTRYGPELLRDKSNTIMFRAGKEYCLLDLDGGNDVFSEKIIFDSGDVNLKLHTTRSALEKVKSISHLISKSSIPFFIGGDHLFTLPIIEGLYTARQKPFTIVQLDYHLDVQVWGEFKDNKPEFLTAPTHSNFMSWIHHKMPDLPILQIGIDNYQTTEKKNQRSVIQYLNQLGTRITNNQIFLSPIQEIISLLPKDQDVYLTIDVDVLNVVYMSATGYPSPTGIGIENLLLLINHLCKNNKLIGVDIMEFGQSKNRNTDHTLYMSTIVINMMLEVLKGIKQ